MITLYRRRHCLCSRYTAAWETSPGKLPVGRSVGHSNCRRNFFPGYEKNQRALVIADNEKAPSNTVLPSARAADLHRNLRISVMAYTHRAKFDTVSPSNGMQFNIIFHLWAPPLVWAVPVLAIKIGGAMHPRPCGSLVYLKIKRPPTPHATTQPAEKDNYCTKWSDNFSLLKCRLSISTIQVESHNSKNIE